MSQIPHGNPHCRPQNNQNQIPSNPKYLKQIHDFCTTTEKPNPANWSYIIRNHLSQGSPAQALLLYTRIRRQGIYILGVLPLILKACASVSCVNRGKALHAESIKSGMNSDVLVGTSLVDMYAKCGQVFESRKVFDYMPERNVVTWNAMIGGYLRSGDKTSALFLFEKMSMRTSVTWVEMIDGFARSGDTVSARRFFDQVPQELKNVVVWTVMADGYSSNGQMEAAREVFEAMPQRNFFVWSSMISGYCKKGDVKEAKFIFDGIPVRNLVNWNSMISGYAQNGFCEEALNSFHKMQAEGFEPDEFTFVSVLSACAQSGLLDIGKDIHNMLGHRRIKLSQIVLNALVDMYAKCGDLMNARLIFEGMTERNTVCWNAMISGLAIHGQCKEALELFGRMEDSNERPDDITFISVLSACAHGGFVDEGIQIFSKMEEYGLVAEIKHFGCVVDLLGRAGRLTEAYALIKRMPIKPNDRVWGAMLGACRVYMDMEMTEQVVKDISTLDSTVGSGDNSHYVLLSNIYAACDRWEKAERTRIDMISEGFEKTPARSSFVPSGS
ncbi:pentatricopeptide repeat-containing protein [Pyrus ussuriensis x Pyrus communis]|uniref:Pentatricopeptide repeat-containing protein n=1 Tax=Pyrus ussuriensis x Pyrus communis TaxID=2448454 RepID=A0A5N5IIR0_9ROSA|nr:pentatricopeptide repeat-containing protein [Pyrus ussuriensis x Pyrus communis]